MNKNFLITTRKALGLTQAEAAERLEMSERHYRRLESGASPITKSRADSIRKRLS